MEIILNGETYQVGENSSVDALLEQLQLQGRRIAVEVNREIIPRTKHTEYKLLAGDQVEIIQAVGGG